MDPLSEAIRHELRRRLAAFVDGHRLAGASAGAVMNGSLAWSAGYGFADLDSLAPADERTLYRIASITKTFTATAILQLRDEGRLRLDDPLTRHLPEFAEAHNPFGPTEDVTLRRLLTHESGLMSDAPAMDVEARYYPSTDDVLKASDRIRVAIPPETAHKYSNLAFQLLGEVVRRASGTPYMDRIRSHILDPLAMTSTAFDPDGDLAGRVAVGYDARRFTDVLRPSARLSLHGIEADGGLYSCVSDLARWVIFQCRASGADEAGSDLLLRPSSLAEMHRPRAVANADWTEAQGLAWYATRRGETVLLGHDGGLNGFRTSIRFSADEGVGTIVLLNGIGPAEALAFDLAEMVLSATREVGDGGPRSKPRAMPDRWAELLGAYVMHDFGEEVRVEWRDGALTLFDGDEWRRLEPAREPLLFLVRGGRSSGETLLFERSPDGRIEGLNLAGYRHIRMVEARPSAP